MSLRLLRGSGILTCWLQARELYGDLLLSLTQDDNAALEHYTQNLAEYPNRSLSILGRARALAALGREEEAAAEYRHFLLLWSDADSDRPELGEADLYLKLHGSSVR